MTQEDTSNFPARPNWIADVNRYDLPVPPAWALQQLWEFDPQLVIIPSLKKVLGETPHYMLCRRRKYSAGLSSVAMLDNKHPDTNMFVKHGVLPIGPLRFRRGKAEWTQQAMLDLLDTLHAMDTWRDSGGPQGDPDKIWKRLEYDEQRAQEKKRCSMWGDFRHMGRDAWRSIKARTGQRNRTSHDGNRFAKVGGARRNERKIIVS